MDWLAAVPLDACNADLPPWHGDRPSLVATALAQANVAAPDLANLAEHMLPRMPRKPLASQTIRSITRDRHSDPFLIDQAVTLPWIALDSEQVTNAIAIDVDHDHGDERAQGLADYYGLPRPIVVQDPWSGRSHVLFMLAAPVPVTDAARVGPRILLDLAGRLLAAALGGTLLPRRSLAKSPWGLAENLIGARMRRTPTPAVPGLWEAYIESGSPLMWRTIPGECHAYKLREIIAALADDFGEAIAAPTTRQRFRKRRPEPSAMGRNCALFDAVRFWAYDHQERDGGAILDEAKRVNATFSNPLPASEVAATARSIAKFMANRYRPRSQGAAARGRDREAGADLDAPQRRGLAGRRTAADRAAATDARIAAAVAALRASGTPLTQAAVAESSGLSLRTVKSRWSRPSMVQDAALSDNAASPAVPGPRSAPSRNPSSSPSSLPQTIGEMARRDRAIRKTVTELTAAAQRATSEANLGAAPDLPDTPAESIRAKPAARHGPHDRLGHASKRRKFGNYPAGSGVGAWSIGLA